MLDYLIFRGEGCCQLLVSILLFLILFGLDILWTEYFYFIFLLSPAYLLCMHFQQFLINQHLIQYIEEGVVGYWNLFELDIDIQRRWVLTCIDK